MARQFATRTEPRTALQRMIQNFRSHRVVALSTLNSLCILFTSWLLVVALGLGNTPLAQAEKPKAEELPPAPANHASVPSVPNVHNVHRAPRPARPRTFSRRPAQPPTRSRMTPRMGRRNYPVTLRAQPTAGR